MRVNGPFALDVKRLGFLHVDRYTPPTRHKVEMGVYRFAGITEVLRVLVIQP